MANRRRNTVLSPAAIERARAKAARQRYLREKKRSEAAKKGWETRRHPDNLFESMAKHLATYRDTKLKRYYGLFRSAKRMLYQIMGSYDAEMLAHNAADLAGWDLQSAMKFAKLS